MNKYNSQMQGNSSKKIKNAIDTVITGELNNSVIKQVLLDLISTKTPFVPFLSISSTNCIKAYLRELPEEGDNAKSPNKDLITSLWKNLLVDSISFLKHNDKREIVGSKGVAFDENIRLLNSYAVSGLTKYIDNFSSFESVLYGSDQWYRDHLNHVILVWTIGLYLLRDNINKIEPDKIFYKFYDKYEFFILDNNDKDGNGSIKEKPLNINICDVDEKYKLRTRFKYRRSKIKNELFEKQSRPYITDGEIIALWTITALCHDLGYPVGKSSKINEEYKKILSHFGKLQIDEFNFSFDSFNDNLIEKFLKIISSRPRCALLKQEEAGIKTDTGTNSEKKNDNDIKDFGYTTVQSKFYDKFAKSLEDYQHGSFSALLLFKTLTYFLETDFSNSIEEKLSYHDLKQFYIRREILRAICAHTCEKIYHVSFRTIPFLLILCDELQAWGRPRFEEIKGGETRQNTKVYIDKIDFNSKSDEYGIHVSLDTTFDDYKKEEKLDELARSDFIKFHHLLRSAKADTRRSFKFIWRVKMLNKTFDAQKGEKEGFLYEFIMDPRTRAEDPTQFLLCNRYIVENNERLEASRQDFEIYKI